MQKQAMFFIALTAVAVPLFALAGLVPCGTTDNPATLNINEATPACTLCDLYVLAQGITNWLMFTAAPLLAVLAIAIGGFYILISGENAGMRSRGFGVIKTTVIGLLITFAAWIIINELLLFFAGSSQQTVGQGQSQTWVGAGQPRLKNLPLPWHQVQCLPPLPPKKTTLPPGSEEDEVRAQLARGGIEINNPPCTGSQTTGCTNVAGLPSNAIKGLIQLKTLCSFCSVVITGGTEPGHRSHAPGQPIVDLRSQNNSDLNTYIIYELGKNQPTTTSYGDQYTSKYGTGTTYLLETKNPNGTPVTPHWHVVFGSGA